MKMFVAGQWLDKSEKSEVHNPYDGSVVDTVPKADAGDVDQGAGCGRRRRAPHARHARLRAVSNLAATPPN